MFYLLEILRLLCHKRLSPVLLVLLFQRWIWRIDLDLPQDPSRIASHAMERRDIFSHYTSCAYCSTSSYGDTSKNNGISSKPAVLPDRDRFAELRTPDAIAEEGVKWMGCRKE